MLTAVADRGQLAGDATRAEARRDHHRITGSEQLSDILIRDLLARDADKIDQASIVDTALLNRLVDRLVGILEGDILADETDLDRILLLRLLAQIKVVAPLLQLRSGSDGELKLMQHRLVHFLLLEE